MFIIEAGNVAELYQNALLKIFSGTMTYPRGFNCWEIGPISMTLINPRKNILNDTVRKINKKFAAAEFLWVVTGREDVEWISKFNSKIKEYSDDGKIFFGAYGPRFIKQQERMMQVLKDDPWSRQGIITLWRQNPPKSKDIPCTVSMHFIRRPVDTLNLIVYMRSNDVWLGLPYDVHNFTCILILIAETLNLKVGTYTQVDGSLHAYTQDMSKIRECLEKISSNDYLETFSPVIESKQAFI